MKILAVNASPNMDKGNTALILNPFLDGMILAGAEAEVIYTRKLKINPCLGCFDCWLKTPGRCVYKDKDDMEKILPLLSDAEIVVYATPLYVDGMSGPLKNLLDRSIPRAESFFELRGGHMRHVPRRRGTGREKAVLISNCGYWEMDNFDPLVEHVKAVCRNEEREFAGALLRPHGPALGMMKHIGAPVDDIFDAARAAGTELVKTGKISETHIKTIGRELLPMKEYFTSANEYFKRAISG